MNIYEKKFNTPVTLPHSLTSPPTMKKILIVDDDDSIRFLFIKKLEKSGFQAIGAKNQAETLHNLARFDIKAVILDQCLGEELGTQLLPKIIEQSPFSKVVFLTSNESVKLATKAMSLGASGFLLKSDPLDENIEKFLNLVEPNQPLPEAVSNSSLELIGQSEQIKNLMRKISRIQASSTTVLLTGESGVGKEMFAKYLHKLSDRRNGPFIAINCAAISESLLEAELFGCKKGAFTDANADRKGYFETCSNGTLLLDEIGETSPALQSKLLRVLQEKEVTPVGSCHPIKIDTRVIAATNKNLRTEIRNKNFREDLYYRLAVISLEIPPLRQRIDDIPLLVENFLKKFNRLFSKNLKPPKTEIYARLKAYGWPGNVRELYNAIERAVLLAESDRMTVEDLLPHKELALESSHNSFPTNFPLDYTEAKDLFEKNYVTYLLNSSNFNISDAAKLSNQYRTNIYRLIKKHNIDINRKTSSKKNL